MFKVSQTKEAGPGKNTQASIKVLTTRFDCAFPNRTKRGRNVSERLDPESGRWWMV